MSNPSFFLAAIFCVLCQAAASKCFGEENAYEEPEIADSDREHWSFLPLATPKIPASAREHWSRNPIDSFISRRLRDAGLRPSPEASRTKLIRRLYLDVVGLPPTPAEIDCFVADAQPHAYERLVEQLLASPEYGPRWAQHWLDLARFAETDGFEHDKVRKEAWRYRDWVVRALNDDMPYDQFVRWQVAGDVVAPNEPAARTATAFCLSGPDMPDINLQEEREHTLLNDITSTVGSVLLGLQVGCAQCHDHMYDAVSQADFYRLRAFFEPAVQVERNKSVSFLAVATDAQQKPSRLMIRGDFRRPGPELEPGFLRVIYSGRAARSNARPPVPRSREGRRVSDAKASIPETPAGPAKHQKLTRAALADWLTQETNPLTARVFVNRVWQYHFGRGLSNTPSDFGVLGSEPSHPQLLDWLASQFIDSGWRIKRLHRLILTSATYRQRGERPSEIGAAAIWEASVKSDPDAVLLSRFPRRRLEAEVIRDSMYAVSGSLNGRMQGPSVMPPLPQEMLSTLLKNQWTASNVEADHYRRSIYVFARRNLRYPLLAMFDRPSANSSCALRNASTTAPQSLLMLNSSSTLDAARRLAGVVWREAGPNEHVQVRIATRRAYGRGPSGIEEKELAGFLREQRRLIEEKTDAGQLAVPIPSPGTAHAAHGAALTDLCLALLNSSEFIYAD